MEKSLVLMSCLLGLTMLGTSVQAATTSGTVTFEDDTTATAPVNPTDPGSPQSPADPNNPANGQTGTLTIDVAPAKIDFGTVTTSNAAKTYNAVGSYNQYLQVSDKRTTANGWKVTVKQDHALTNTTTNHVLTGAVIHLPKGTARNSLNATPSTIDTNFTTTAVDITTADQEVISAPNQTGIGKAVTTDTWTASGVTLSVPKLTARTGNYTNTLTWTLVAAAN